MRWLKHVNFLKLIRYCLVVMLLSASFRVQSQSALASGNWIRIGITETGIYKLDHAFLKKWGVQNFENYPAGIRLYGNGGGMLPQKNDMSRPKDLVENAIWVDGEADGVFNQNDGVYFYAEGPHIIYADTTHAQLHHQTNLYSDTTFYYLTTGSAPGRRIAKASLINTPAAQKTAVFDDYWFHEKESYNLLRSGREWWGEYLGTSIMTFPTGLSGVVPGSKIVLSGSAIASSPSKSSFGWYINDKFVGTDTVGAVSGAQYSLRAQYSEKIFTTAWTESSSTPLSGGVLFNRGGQNAAIAYLNFLGIQTKRILQAYDQQQLYHFFPASSGSQTYSIGNAPGGWFLWDVSHASSPSFLTEGNNGQTEFTISSDDQYLRFIGFKPADAKSPASSQRIANQDINTDLKIDLLIVTAPAFRNSADQLAEFRRMNDNLNVKVVSTTEIYNQYASGQTDVTAIRDYVKHVYSNSDGQLKYLLLFGDASYDYKNNYLNQTASQRQAWVPVYESRESLHPVYTFSSDDYFGFLQSGEGEWVESTAGDHRLSIGIGRLPVKSTSEAKDVVAKIIHYASSKGKWKNEIRFVADDGDGNIHQTHADRLAALIGDRLLSSRIFIDEFPQTETALGQKAPEVNNRIRSAINSGCLILNYTGHGGASGWAQEQILTLSDMIYARGYDNLPLLVTATCDFGRYDDMSQVSGGELMVLSPRGGAVASLSTTRPVYSSTNFTLNNALYDAILKNTGNQRLGDITRVTKNNSLVGSLNRNFTLIGDPTLMLISDENYIRWKELPDTLSASGNYILKGQICSTSDSLPVQNFNGLAHIALYDRPTSFQTLGDEDEKQSYNEFREKIFQGVATVTNGNFVVGLTMPKETLPSYGIGRASMYAFDENRSASASGQLKVVTGGAPASETDVKAPEISGFMNDSLFRDGDHISPASMLIIQLADEHGINLGYEKGYGIRAMLNDTLEINLTDFYTAHRDDFRKGTVVFPFENLAPGPYSITIKVWDNYNNLAKLTFGFQVDNNRGIEIETFKLYPNPFKNDYTFTLTQNRANQDVEITLKILSLSGQILGSQHWTYYNSAEELSEMVTSSPLTTTLNAHTNYFYILEIRSLQDNSLARKTGRIFRNP